MPTRLCRLEGVQFSRTNGVFIMFKKGKGAIVLKSFNDIFKFATWGNKPAPKKPKAREASPACTRKTCSRKSRPRLYRGEPVYVRDIVRLVPGINPRTVSAAFCKCTDANGNIDKFVDRMIAKYGMTDIQEDRLNIVDNAAEDLRQEIVKKMMDTTEQERLSEALELTRDS